MVTSPPYLGLRDYSAGESEIGKEPTIQEFVDVLVDVFREVRRVLKPTGVAWLNIGDGYVGSGRGEGMKPETMTEKQRSNIGSYSVGKDVVGKASGLAQKNMMLVPERIIIALQDDGWTARQRHAWFKSNAMPESVKDRDASSFEMIYMLTKSSKYWWDQEAGKIFAQRDSIAALRREARAGNALHAYQYKSKRDPVKLHQAHDGERGQWADVPGQTPHTKSNRAGRKKAAEKAVGREPTISELQGGVKPHRAYGIGGRGRNVMSIRKNVWIFPSAGYKGGHYASFPEELPLRCIRSSCPPGGVVLDPFAGTGTTGVVARKLKMDSVMIELNPEYVEIMKKRLEEVPVGDL